TGPPPTPRNNTRARSAIHTRFIRLLLSPTAGPRPEGRGPGLRQAGINPPVPHRRPGEGSPQGRHTRTEARREAREGRPGTAGHAGTEDARLARMAGVTRFAGLTRLTRVIGLTRMAGLVGLARMAGLVGLARPDRLARVRAGTAAVAGLDDRDPPGRR